MKRFRDESRQHKLEPGPLLTSPSLHSLSLSGADALFQPCAEPAGSPDLSHHRPVDPAGCFDSFERESDGRKSQILLRILP